MIRTTGTPSRLLAAGVLACAALVALTALCGIFLPSTYARETASWAAQGVGQDWANLLVAVPWLLTCGALVSRGSRRAELLLAGAMVYLVYSYVLYAVGVHFNSLFLAYCAVLGVAFWTLAGIGLRLRHDPAATLRPEVPVKLAGGFLIALAALFYVLWLSEDLPALAKGVAPASLAEVDLPSNPVHVLDLAIVLPAMTWSGVALLQRRPLGAATAAILLAFCLLMTVAIAVMAAVMRLRGVTSDPTPAVVMGATAAACAIVLARFLRRSGAEG
jgi:hypothetical protein